MNAKNLQHLNGNLLCAIDCETTGLKAGYHDIIQVCFLPLDSEIKPIQNIPPFYMTLKPQRPETVDKDAMKVHGIPFMELMQYALDPFTASERFEEWFNALNLGLNKKIAPLGHNYAFDQGFIRDWLGDSAYETYFDYHVRDTAAVALFLNDRSAFASEACPFPKVRLSFLAERLACRFEHAHDALQDCLATAEVYRRIIHRSLGHFVEPNQTGTAQVDLTDQAKATG